MAVRVAALLILLGTLACDRATETAHRLPTAEVAIGQRIFTLELALDRASRHRGFAGRNAIGPHQGMLLVLPRPRMLATVMRDCLVPIDVAFLDRSGRVLALYTMPPEPPRRRGESEARYEDRLPRYASRLPAQFVLEVSGGEFAALGVTRGHRLRMDWDRLARRAR